MAVPMLRRLLLALIPAAVLASVLSTVSLPYYAEGPGPARDVFPLIRISGHERYASDGRFILTAVSFQPVNAFGAVAAWLDPVRSLVPKSDLVGPGETEEEADRRAVSQMDQSKIDAAYLVLRTVTDYPKEHLPGALVESVSSACPAAGHLFPGDLIRQVEGHAIGGVPHFRRVMGSVEAGAPVDLVVEAGGESHDVTVTPAPCEGSKRPLLGVSLVPNFPFEVSISSGEIGGPSAGLMWALGLYDALTPGDLTGGGTVAGTGQIAPDGTVLPIGGVKLKVEAARRAGAQVFLVPRANLGEAQEAPGGISLVPVDDFSDALDYLQDSA